MYKSFTYIIKNENKLGASISEAFTLEEICARFTVYSAANGYRVYDNLRSFHGSVSGGPWNEVIFDVPQKLKFDIDAPANVVDDYAQAFANICQGIYDTFFTSYGIMLQEHDLIITKSHSSTKYSNHIIIDNYYVSSSIQSREFTRRLIDLVGGSIIDKSVNKPCQNFRIVGCHKVGDRTRTKDLITPHDPIRTYITNVDQCTLLLDLVANVHVAPLTMPGTDLDFLIEKYTPVDHVYRSISDNRIEFKRVHASMCEFCTKVHDHDNTFYLKITTHEGNIYVHKHCRKNNGPGILLEAITTHKQTPQGRVSRWIRTVDAYRRQISDTIPTVKICEYEDTQLRPLELVPTLCVHAMMKMGKTKALISYIDKHFPSNIIIPKIRFISFRQTFSANIKEKFPNFTLYSDIKGMIYVNRLIIQVESLHRLAIQPGESVPDLLVLDESESIFEQFDSGLLGHFAECFAKFEYLLKHSKHVVCMDANITQRTINILHEHRGEVHMHVNKYKNAVDDRVFITESKQMWLGVLASTVAEDKVAIAISSLSDAKAIHDMLSKIAPKAKVCTYTSETSAIVKKEHFADVNKYWALCDILIFTPTVSAGVSFEIVHFNKVFGYFTNMSCPVETCTQMMGRIRDVSHKSYFIYVDWNPMYLPIKVVDIRESIRNRRENLYATYDNIGLTIEYAADGAVKLHESSYFHIYLENMRMKNISKTHFGRQLVHRILQTGAMCEELTEDIYEELTGDIVRDELGQYSDTIMDLMEIYRTTKLQTKDENALAVASSIDITEVEAFELSGEDDLTVENKRKLQKYRLRKHYVFEHEITQKFVRTYMSDRIKRNYKNLVRIAAGLDSIQTVEKNRFDTMQQLAETDQHHDIHTRYVFDQHRYALMLIKLCGWRGLTDTSYKHVNEFDLKTFFEVITTICAEFGIRQTARQNDIKSVITVINKILSVVYGISIALSHTNTYVIRANNKFAYNVDCTTKPTIPLIQN